MKNWHSYCIIESNKQRLVSIVKHQTLHWGNQRAETGTTKISTTHEWGFWTQTNCVNNKTPSKAFRVIMLKKYPLYLVWRDRKTAEISPKWLSAIIHSSDEVLTKFDTEHMRNCKKLLKVNTGSKTQNKSTNTTPS